MEELYKKSKGNAGLEGVQFQLNLLIVFLLNALRNFKNWKISSENPKACKYDDLVLELSDKSVLLQAKFKQNKKINKDQLFSCNSKNTDFSLPKYFFSYLEVQSASIEKTVIICTNTSIDERGLENFLTRHIVSPGSMLNYEGATCPFFTFNDNILVGLKASAEDYLDKNLQGKGFDKAVITDENIKDFLKHLQFFSNYPCGDKLDKVIGQLLARLNSSSLFRGISSLELYKKIEDWFKQPKGEYLTEERAKAMFSEIRSDRFCAELKNYNVSFRCNELNFTDPKRVFVINSEGGYLLPALKIYNALQNDERKKLYVNPTDEVEVQKQVMEAFTFSRYCFLIIIGFKITEEVKAKEIICKLKDMLIKYSYKKVILVTDNNNKLSQQIGPQDVCHIDGSVTFEHLSDDCQKELVTARNIIFQGDEISLEELLATDKSEDWARAVNSEILEELVRQNTIKIGAFPEDSVEDNSRYYVHRTFKREHTVTSPHSYVNYINNIEEEIFPEETICDVKEDVVLIADSAGMGKTTVLVKLAKTIKEKYPYLWVIRIVLADYSDILRKLIKNGEETISIFKLLNSKMSTQMTNYLGRFVFSMNRRIVLLLDGIDEISPDYTKLILNCLVQCLQEHNIAKLFVTTRPHMVLELESVLKVEPFILQPFTEKNQVDFLTLYWAYNLEVDRENKGKCEQYASTLICRMSSWTEMYDYKDITAIPLQLRMLAEIFQESIKWNESSDWEGCKEYLNASQVFPKLPERMEIKKLYDLFVEKKRDIYIHKGNPSGNSMANKVLMGHFDESLTSHKRFALELIVRKEDCPLFSCYRQSCVDINEDILKIGIIQKSNHELNFIHRTFAEYFVTKSLVSELELQLYCPNLIFQQFIIDQIFQFSEYKVIRTFLESFLQWVKYSIPLNIFDDYKSHVSYLLHRENEYDLIHLLASEGCVTILQLILNCLNFKVIRNKEANRTDLCNRFFGNEKNIFQSFKRRIGIDTKTKKGNVLRVVQLYIQECGINIKNTLGRTPLQEAAENGHYEMVRFLVENGAIINSIDNEGDTALHFAALSGRLDIVKFLVESGSDVNIIDNAGCTALHFALIKGHSEVTEYLAKSGGNVNIKDKGDKTALHIAAANGHLYTVKFLFERGVDVSIADVNGMTALHVAARRGQLIIINYLIKLGGDVNIKDINGRTALHLAVANGHLDTAISLLECGADTSIRNVAGRTALYLAAKNGYLDTVTFLLERNFDVAVGDVRVRVALYLAAENGHLNIVKYILERAVDVNVRNVACRTALHFTVMNGHLDTVKFLFRRAVNPDVREFEGSMALLLAAANGHLDTIMYFLQQGVNVNVGDAICRTALHFAAANGHLDTVKFLLEQSVDVNVKEIEGRTALHFAIANGHFDTVKYLLQTSIDVNARDVLGKTALHLAIESDRLDTLKILLKGGADMYVGDIEGRPALHLAVATGRLNTAKFLLEEGTDVNVVDVEGNTVLHLVAANGNLDEVKFLLKRGADINIRDVKGRPALHLAAANSHLATVKHILLETSVDVDIRDAAARTALHLAAENGHLNTVEFILKLGADVTLRDFRGRTALHLAAANGHLATIKYLLLKTNVYVDIGDVQAGTALCLAAASGHLDVAKFLIERDADVNSKTVRGTALHLAAVNDNLDMGKFLYEKGANTNVGDDEGRTTLHLFAANGNLDAVKFLLECDADISIRDVGGRTALHLAAGNGHLDIVKFLLEQDTDVNFKDVKCGTALHLAAAHNHLDTVKFLLLCGADVSIGDIKHRTALHLAAANGNLDTVKFLLQEGADVNVGDVRGWTALHSAATEGRLAIVEYLVNLCNDVNIRDVNGNTALHFAAANGYFDSVKFLLDWGADVNVRDVIGNTALHLAVEENNFKTVKLLVERGVDVNVGDFRGWTALHSAVKLKRLAIVEYLVKLCNDINLNDVNGNTHTPS